MLFRINWEVDYANGVLESKIFQSVSLDKDSIEIVVPGVINNDIEQADEIIWKYFNLSTTDSFYRNILEDIWSGVAEYYLS